MAVYSHFGPNGSKGPRTAGAAQQAWRQEVDGIGSSLPLRPGTVANDGGSSTSDLPGRPASEDSAMGADERGTEASRSENARPAAGRQARSKRRGGINAYYSNVSNTPDAAA